MKTLLAAFLLALHAAIIVYFFCRLLGVEQSVAGQIAVTIIGGVPYLRESLEKYLAIRTHPEGLPVLSLGQFGLPPRRMVLYGTLVLFSVMLLASVLGGILTAVWSVEPMGVNLVTAMMVIPAAFFIGRWVGRRAEANGLFVLLLIAVFARSAGTFIDLIGTANFAFYLRAGLGEGSFLQHIALQIIIGVGLFFSFGALGYWQGTRQQLGSYLSYLLQEVPASTRRSIVDLAFEEAGRVSASKATAQPSAPARGSPTNDPK